MPRSSYNLIKLSSEIRTSESAIAFLKSQNLLNNATVCQKCNSVNDTVCKGSLQIGFLEKIGILSQLRGGGLPIPSFYPIFPRVLLLGFCCNMGVPQSQPKITLKITKNHIKNHQLPKKMGLFHEKITCLE